MAKKTILVVDDEEGIRILIQLYLEKKGYFVLTAANGEDALHIVDREEPDLILLDIEMPGMDGFEVCWEIRKKRTVPILFLSVRRDVMDKIKCFELGGDDYVIKPFDYAELEARIQANLRRYYKDDQLESDLLIYGDLKIHLDRYMCYLNDQLVPLSAKEVQLLILLAQHPNQVWSAEQLYDHIWGVDSAGEIQTVKVHISHLRRKLEKDPTNPKFIQTVRGLGYVFSTDDV
ncbi:response regulator transcription factor [Virgibacillus sp. W0181]|uniref:response regulator transcription factor n=1 Tax=Virgibacillus sp. W0181 TaxID=3391581 RepID=UPI003F456375